MKLKVAIVVLTLVLSGCASTYQHSALTPVETILSSEVGVVISTPEDGWYSSTEYKNSGMMTANAVRAAFVKHGSRVKVLNDCHGDDCFTLIDPNIYGYYVKPVILHWEDRATEWSGKRDRVEIQLIVYDVVTQEELANATYTGKSKWATFGGDHPQDLLPDPTNQLVASWYGK